jgi:hypothetical protein
MNKDKQKKAPAKKTTSPTGQQFAAYQAMYAHLNRKLFAGELPAVFLNFSRHSGAVGFYAPDRWHLVAGDLVAHEISLNPSHLGMRTARETAATLAHEMCHHWQRTFGRERDGGKRGPRTGYHDREWAEKMVSVGLQPIDPKTGEDKMSAPALTHRIVEGGPFARVFETMPAEALLPWSCVELTARPSSRKGGARGEGEGEGEGGEGPAKSRNKVKLTCPSCGANAWGKPGLRLLCDDGHAPARLADPDAGDDEAEGDDDPDAQLQKQIKRDDARRRSDESSRLAMQREAVTQRERTRNGAPVGVPIHCGGWVGRRRCAVLGRRLQRDRVAPDGRAHGLVTAYGVICVASLLGAARGAIALDDRPSRCRRAVDARCSEVARRAGAQPAMGHDPPPLHREAPPLRRVPQPRDAGAR